MDTKLIQSFSPFQSCTESQAHFSFPVHLSLCAEGEREGNWGGDGTWGLNLALLAWGVSLGQETNKIASVFRREKKYLVQLQYNRMIKI